MLNVKEIMFLGFILHVSVAVWNGFFGPSFGAETDALGMHYHAVSISQNLDWDDFKIGTMPYTNLLAVIYFFTFDSVFLGSLLSCGVWLASAGTLTKIMRLLSLDRSHQIKAMLIYSLLPSSILFTSVTLRESYQLFFVNLAIYSTLKIYLNKYSVHWMWLLFAIVGMSVLHGALFVFGVFIIVSTLMLLALRRSKGFPWVRFVYVVPFVALIVLYGFSLFTSVSYSLDDGLATSVETYQQGGIVLDGRSNYKDSVEINGITGLVFFIPISLFKYLFEPMPWRILSAPDVEVFLENILRAWLIWKALSGLRNMPRLDRRPVMFVFISYLVIETIWSLGTINWGTSVRHHIPGFGLLLIAAFAYSENHSIKRARSLHTSLEGAV